MTTERTDAQPSTRVLLFDGDCGFCTSSARWLEDWLPTPPPIAPWQHTDISRYGLTADECSHAVQWIDGSGNAVAGARAIAALLQDAGGWRRYVGTAGTIAPTSWLADGAYRVVARNRYRLPGGTPACRVATPSAGPHAE